MTSTTYLIMRTPAHCVQFKVAYCIFILIHVPRTGTFHESGKFSLGQKENVEERFQEFITFEKIEYFS